MSFCFKAVSPVKAIQSCSLTMSIPVFSSLRRSAKTQQAKIEVAKASEELLQTEKRVLIELENAKTNYQFAINNFQNAQKNLSLAKKN